LCILALFTIFEANEHETDKKNEKTSYKLVLSCQNSFTGGRGCGRGSFPAHFGKRGVSRDSRYDKQDSRHTGDGRSGGTGSGRGGGFDGRYSSGSGGAGSYNNRY
jgi:hypothetical protein